MRQPIVERFTIAGKGTAVVVSQTTGLPVGKPLRATIHSKDGSRFTAVAFKEWLLRRNPTPIEHEAYLLKDVTKEQVPEGASIEIAL